MKKIAAGLVFTFLCFLLVGNLDKLGRKKTSLAVGAAQAAAGGICSSTIEDDTANNEMAYGQTIGYLAANHGSTNFEPKIAADGKFSGMVYGQTFGWVSLSGVSVNCQTGIITGNAYGQTIGYINFGPSGSPKIDLITKEFSGYAYSQTAGWISLEGWKVKPAKILEIEKVTAEPFQFTSLDSFPTSSDITIDINTDTLTADPPFKYEFDCNGNGNYDDIGIDKTSINDLFSASESCAFSQFADVPSTINVKASSVTHPEAVDTDSASISKIPMVKCEWDICDSFGPDGNCGDNNHIEFHQFICQPNPDDPNVKVCSSDADCFSGGKDWIEVTP